MVGIWYLLRCPKGDEHAYVQKYQQFTVPGKVKEVIYFKYQRLMRWGGKWHMETLPILPGCIFLSAKNMELNEDAYFLTPCERPYLKDLCWEDNLVPMSRGMIKNGRTIVTKGPLKGRECLIRRIDRHKRIAEIEIALEGQKRQVTVGLEINEKQ